MRKKIKNYDNYYIYDNGDVLNVTTNKILKGSIGEHGYKYYRLSKNNEKTMFYTHRLVAEAFIENPNNYNVVNHKNGDKTNNNVENLEWITQSENVKAAYDQKLIKPRKQSEYYQNDLDGEIWKQIPNYHYSVSSCGRIKNDITQLLLRPSITCGYYKVRLSANGQVKDFIVHKLVYCIFNNIEEISNEFVIDHIDANKLNNNITNLRLISKSDNVKAAYYEQKTNSSCKKVEQLTLTGEYIKTFLSCAEAARELNLDSSTISKVCRGQNKSHGGFLFRYVK